jgi:hypothetical protein
MELQRFKLEIDIFDEHHLQNILRDFHDSERYYISTDDGIIIEGINFSKNNILSSNLSMDNKFIILNDSGNTKIYAISSSDSISEYLYMTIIDMSLHNPIMYKNLIYSHDKIIDILNKKIYKISLPQYTKNIYVYKNIICAVSRNSIIFLNPEGNYSHFEGNFEYINNNQNEKVSEVGIFYLFNENNIFTVGVENHTITATPHEYSNQLIQVIYSKLWSGLIYVLFDEIIFPNGMKIHWKNFTLDPERKSLYDENSIIAFSHNLKFNTLGNKIICYIQYVIEEGNDIDDLIVVIIDLHTTLTTNKITILKQINLQQNICNVGFIELDSIEKPAPTILNYKDFEVIECLDLP